MSFSERVRAQSAALVALINEANREGNDDMRSMIRAMLAEASNAFVTKLQYEYWHEKSLDMVATDIVYHVTKEEYQESINQLGLSLFDRDALDQNYEEVFKRDPTSPQGYFFTVARSLDWDLPSKTQYHRHATSGDTMPRLKIPIASPNFDNLDNHFMFHCSIHSPKRSDKLQILLVFVNKDNDHALQWCRTKLRPIEKENNPFFRYNNLNQTWSVVDYYRHNMWVNLIIIPHTAQPLPPLPGVWVWDEVERM